MTTFDHETYLSPLTWRYGSDAMRIIWSEAQKRRLLRRFWVALATAQHEAGLVTAEQVAELRANQDKIDIVRATEIEQRNSPRFDGRDQDVCRAMPYGRRDHSSRSHLDGCARQRRCAPVAQALDLLITNLASLAHQLGRRASKSRPTPQPSPLPIFNPPSQPPSAIGWPNMARTYSWIWKNCAVSATVSVAKG